MRKNIRRTLSVVLVLLLALGGFSLYNHLADPVEEKTELTSTVIQNQIQEASDLITSKYFYTNAGSFEKARHFHSWRVPLTRSHFVATYDGIIHAGVDLKETQVDVVGDQINITLPEAQIMAHEIKEDSLEILDESSSVFNQLKVADFQQFTSEQEKSVEAAAIENGLLDNTRTASQQAVLSLVNVIPEVAEGEYTVNFN